MILILDFKIKVLEIMWEENDDFLIEWEKWTPHEQN